MQKDTNKTSMWTAANIVTMIRVVFIPVWLFVAMRAVPFDAYVEKGYSATFSSSALFVAIFYMVLSLTDKLDGYLARSRNEVTTFGKFLDPIADKLIVMVALMYLLYAGQVSIWVPCIIVAREFLVSGLRMVLASSGTVVAASNLGKWKTATTMMGICGLLLSYACYHSTFIALIYTLSNILIWVAVVLTIWSGVDYFVKGKEALKD